MLSAGEDGLGVAQIRTARGILTHAAELAGGVVSRYQIWAPTDMFFQNETVLSVLLAGQTWGNLDQMRQGVNQAILALDPCLPYVMELNDA
jgi:coenzyme F420-reducing hydrogenase alpha subunit